MSTYTDQTIPTTGLSLKTMSSASQRQLWEEGAKAGAREMDYFAQFEGDESAMIQRKNEFKAGAGSILNFDAYQDFHHRPHTSDETFPTAAHYEGIRLSGSQLKVDTVRNAAMWNDRAGPYMGIKSEFKNMTNIKLGEWLGRTRSHMMLMSLRHQGTTANTLFINGGASLDTLLPTDTLTWDSVVDQSAALTTLGGQPFTVKMDPKGNEINGKMLIATNMALSSLKADPTYKSVSVNAEARGPDNPLFRGGWTMVDGNIVKEFIMPDHASYGPIGSPLAPKAQLGAAVAVGTTTFKGGGSVAAAADTLVDYFRDFPNFGYVWSADTYLAAGDGSTRFYAWVINPPTGADANKCNFYECSTNDGQTITITNRFVPSSGTVGDITWADLGTDIQARITNDHPVGATMYLANSIGTLVGYSIFAGKQTARRGYGEPLKRAYDEDEGGFIKRTFIVEVFGQAPVRDVGQRCPNYQVVAHAIRYPGQPIPILP